MLTIPMNYTSFGGTYTIATGVNAGSQVFGQDPLWLAWANDLINFKKAGDMAAYNNLLATVTPARFKVGQNRCDRPAAGRRTGHVPPRGCRQA